MDKLIRLGFTLALIFIIAGCGKYGTAYKVVRNCTGVYLEKRGQHYKVCNSAILVNYNEGDKVKVTFDELDECFGLGGVSCEMQFISDKNIEITDIK